MYQWEQNNANSSANNNNAEGGNNNGQQSKKNKKSAHNQTNTTFHASESFPTDFESLAAGQIRPQTVEVLKTKLGFSSLLPAQARCYNHIFKGSDTVLHSRTGTGKTLAFLLPLIERHMGDVDRQREDRKGPWMTILLPTIELAAQIQRVISEVFYPSASKKTVTTKKTTKKNQAAAAEEEQEVSEDAAATSSIRGVRCLVAGLDASNEDDLLNRCDILVGTVHAVDSLLRYRVDAQGNKISGKSGNNSSNASDDEDDSDDVDSEEDDEDLQTINQAKQITGDRRRSRSSTEKTASKPKNTANTNKNKFHQNKTKYVASPAAKFIRTVVIDEVDHTLGPKFSSSARRVHNLLKSIKAGSTLFSVGMGMQFVLVGATIPDWIQRVGFLGDPNRRVTFRLVSAGTSKLPEGLKCFSVECSRAEAERVAMTCRLLKQIVNNNNNKETKRVVVFAPTKLVELIAASKTGSNSKINIRRLDSTADDVERLRVINEFNQGVANVLVCTDRASRGLDFTNIDTVISTSFPPPAPTSAETFVHRAGRAGRAGKPGNCITLLDVEHGGEMQSKKMIESTAHIVFRPFEVTVGAEEVEVAVVNNSKFSHNNSNHKSSSSKAKQQQQQQQKSSNNNNSSAEIICNLKVKNPFKVGGNNNNNNNKNNQRPTRTAKQVLETTVGEDLLKKISVVESGSTDELVRFKVSKLLVEDVRSALWKYDITIEKQ